MDLLIIFAVQVTLQPLQTVFYHSFFENNFPPSGNLFYFCLPFHFTLFFYLYFYSGAVPLLVALCWDGLGAAWDVAMIAPHQ